MANKAAILTVGLGTLVLSGCATLDNSYIPRSIFNSQSSASSPKQNSTPKQNNTKGSWLNSNRPNSPDISNKIDPTPSNNTNSRNPKYNTINNGVTKYDSQEFKEIRENLYKRVEESAEYFKNIDITKMSLPEIRKITKMAKDNHDDIEKYNDCLSHDDTIYLIDINKPIYDRITKEADKRIEELKKTKNR